MGRLWKSRGLHGRGRGLAGGRPGGGGADKAAIIQGKSPVPNTTPLRRPVPSASPGSRATPPPRCSPPVPQCPHSPSDLCWGTKHEGSMLPRSPSLPPPPLPICTPKLADTAADGVPSSSSAPLQHRPWGLHTPSHPTPAPPSPSPCHQFPQHPRSLPPAPAMPRTGPLRAPSCLGFVPEQPPPKNPFLAKWT